MKQKQCLLMILALAALGACEKTVHIDIPKKDPRLVISGQLVKDDLFRVSIGKSRGILEHDNNTSNAELYTVKTAKPVIFENGIAIDTLVYQPATFDYLSAKNKRVRDGFVYNLVVAAPGFKTAETVSAVPSQSVIAELRRVKNSRTISNGILQDEITIKLNDPGGERNFYLVQVWNAGFGGGFNYPVYCVNTPDKDVEQTGIETDPLNPDNCFDGKGLLMRDINFNGGVKQLKLFVDSDQLAEFADPITNKTFRPFIKVFRITEDEFKYIKSDYVYNSANDNPFAEPVNLFSNVKNGYGIFSLSTQAVDTLR